MKDYKDFGLLLIQEPHCFRTDEGVVTTPQHHAYWTPYTPTTHNPAGYWPFRSMIWAHRGLTVKQVPIPTPDITALLIRTGDRRILVCSIQNHFGARKCRSTTQALTLLQERIYDAWREQKVLSLVSYDVKGAYNGVNREVLLQRLRARHLPTMLVNWVASFCTGRQAMVVINGHDSVTTNLTHPGLPQGSPLSPILFLFFNANLVSSVLNKHQGAIVFVDGLFGMGDRPIYSQ